MIPVRPNVHPLCDCQRGGIPQWLQSLERVNSPNSLLHRRQPCRLGSSIRGGGPLSNGSPRTEPSMLEMRGSDDNPCLRNLCCRLMTAGWNMLAMLHSHLFKRVLWVRAGTYWARNHRDCSLQVECCTPSHLCSSVPATKSHYERTLCGILFDSRNL